jgi:hypothetical protein
LTIIAEDEKSVTQNARQLSRKDAEEEVEEEEEDEEEEDATFRRKL